MENSPIFVNELTDQTSPISSRAAMLALPERMLDYLTKDLPRVQYIAIQSDYIDYTVQCIELRYLDVDKCWPDFHAQLLVIYAIIVIDLRNRKAMQCK